MIPADYPLPAARARIAALKRALDEFRSAQRATYGIYLEDLHSGLAVNLNGDDRYVAASTTKFPVSLYTFHHAASGVLDLSLTVEYLPQDRTGGTGAIQYAPFGTTYTLRQLCYHAIVDSDNVAWRMLYRQLGEPRIKEWMRSIGGRLALTGYNVAAPTDYAVYCKFLLEFADRNPGLGGTLLEWLKRSGYYNWAPKYLPRGISMAHKIGAWPTAINDVGVIFLKRAPYLLCLMTDLTNDRRLGLAIENLAQIGNIAFRYMRPMAGQFAGVRLNGKPLVLRQPACLTGGTVVVPIRDLAEALGARVSWDAATQTTILHKGEVTAGLSVGSKELKLGDELRVLPVAPFLFEGAAIGPLRMVAEVLGARVEWDPDRYRVLMSL